MSSPRVYQATTFAANANGATLALLGTKSEITVYFGAGVVFGAGTLTLQVSPDGGTTWVSTGNTYTSATADTKIPAVITVYGTHVRWALTGATAPTINVAMKAEQKSYNSDLAFTITANGSTAAFTIPRDEAALAFTIHGTFDSASVTLQASPDGGTTWFKYGGAVTAASYNAVSAVTDMMFRFTTTGIVTAAALTVKVFQ